MLKRTMAVGVVAGLLMVADVGGAVAGTNRCPAGYTNSPWDRRFNLHSPNTYSCRNGRDHRVYTCDGRETSESHIDRHPAFNPDGSINGQHITDTVDYIRRNPQAIGNGFYNLTHPCR